MSTVADPGARPAEEAEGNDVGGSLDRPVPPPVRGRRAERLRHRRRRNLTVVLAIVLIAVLTVGGVLLFRPRSTPAPPRVAPPVQGEAPASVAWAVQWGDTASLVLVAEPPGKAPIAVAVPDDTFVDLPSGSPNHVGEAAVTGPAALEALQSLFGRRVGHFLSSTPDQIGALVDALGGVHVDAETQFQNAGADVGPGPLAMNGSMAVAYLTTAEGVDAWVRWEDVVAGILGAQAKPSAWRTPPGVADSAPAVTSLLQSARGATVVEVATGPSVQGGVAPDPKKLETLKSSKLGEALGAVVRVIVQNGNGRPGQGAAIGALLATRGFLVVASQNASSFDVLETQIVAANGSFLPWANEAQGLLRAGKVYLGTQPTGVADVTIIVGKDFATG